jgi:hypothetical protein
MMNERSTERGTPAQKALLEALREADERAVSDSIDLWPAISERVGGRAAAGPRRSGRQRLVPRTRVGWAFALLLVLLFGTAAYAASGLVYEAFLEELPGGEGSVFGENLNMEQTAENAGGARVTLEWAYADTKFVVVGFSVQDLEADRQNVGNPASLEPVLAGEKGVDEVKLPPHVDLTDEAGREFDLIDGTVYSADEPELRRTPRANTAVFAAPKDLEPSGAHRFRLEVPLEDMPIIPPRENRVRYEPEPVPGPFVFDFEIPVRSTPIVEVDREVEANGVTIILGRVVNSPARPQAIICFEPPDDEHLWRPLVKHTGFASDEPIEPQRLEDGCWSVTLGDLVEGRSSVTVTELMGIPRNPSEAAEGPKTIRGPWTFEFEGPAP